MTGEVNLIHIAKGFLSKNNVVLSDVVTPDEIVDALAHHIDALIYNITSLAALVAMIQGDEKIQPKHLVSAQSYIAHKCIGDEARKKVTGGIGNRKSAKEVSELPVPVLEGFELDVTAIECLDTDLRSFVHGVLNHHDVSISKGAMKSILDILHSHLGCLLKDIRENEPLTLKRLEAIMTTRRHAVFN